MAPANYNRLLTPVSVVGYLPSVDPADYVAAVEFNARCAVSHCAAEVLFPSLPSGLAKLGCRISTSALPPSLKRRVRIVDRRDAIWKSLRKYFEPIAQDLNLADNGAAGWLVGLAWDLYLLTLATKNGCEVSLDLAEEYRPCLREILHSHSSALRPESKARLATISGIVNAFRESASLPGLEIIPGTGTAFSDRISEILEDAYLLEASWLRRFLGLNPNKAAVRRDLRKLVQFISKKCGWARGVVRAGSHVLGVPDDVGRLVEGLGGIMKVPGVRASTPVVVSPDRNIVHNVLLDMGITVEAGYMTKAYSYPIKTLHDVPGEKSASLCYVAHIEDRRIGKSD